ncbi:hypothetical protein ISCGN_010056 [Ixodes scapularis]
MPLFTNLECAELNGSIPFLERGSYAQQARLYSFAIRHGFNPPEVLRLLGGVPPSAGHGKRICRILRSERWKQVSRLRDALWLLCHESTSTEREACRKYGEHLRLASKVKEFLWDRLRSSLPKKKRRFVSPDCVTFLGDATAPPDVTRILDKGPKYSLAPRMKPVDKLGLVRTLADKAAQEDRDSWSREKDLQDTPFREVEASKQTSGRFVVALPRVHVHRKRGLQKVWRAPSTCFKVTEFLWDRLRSSLPKKKRRFVSPDCVTFLGDATAPPDVTRILDKGPKYSLAPRMKPVDKLGLATTSETPPEAVFKRRNTSFGDHSYAAVSPRLHRVLATSRQKLQKARKLLKQAKKKVNRKTARIRKLNTLLRELRTRLPKPAVDILDNAFTNTMSNLVLKRVRRNKNACTEDVRKFALTLHFYSAKAYSFLRKHVKLPHPSTQRKWAAVVDARPATPGLQRLGNLLDLRELREQRRHDLRMGAQGRRGPAKLAL